jgi:hypothetical protein
MMKAEEAALVDIIWPWSSVSVTIAVCCKKYWLLHFCHDYGASVTIAVFCKKYWASIMLLQLSVAKEWHISETVYTIAYDKVTSFCPWVYFFYILSVTLIASLSVSLFFYAIYTIYRQIRHGAVVERTLLQVQLQIQFTLFLFSCDALFVMVASSLPYTFLLVIHCLAWLLFLLTANLNIAFG